ncbi:MAG: 2,3,4,5-tetrahydropyridine-2,6-dicarboxylate N-succinyltransferase [Pseudomonadota bacterium]
MTWQTTLRNLENGQLRAAEKSSAGDWQANQHVKQAILEVFKAGKNQTLTGTYQGFVDKNNLPPRMFTEKEQVRMVPGGSAVRAGAYIASSVVIMPPAYVNIGAYVGEGTMIDSHVLVGSCAQIGAHVHLSAGVQIGGVLEPIGMTPVVIEDRAFIGAGAIIVESMVVGAGAVIAPSVVLSQGVQLYDLTKEKILPKGSPVPAGAVVVPGSRPLNTAWAKKHGLQAACPVIVKYRDDKSDAVLNLEEALR